MNRVLARIVAGMMAVVVVAILWIGGSAAFFPLSTVDIDNGSIASRDREVDYYVGYSHAVGDVWTLGANAVAYTFPGAEGAVDYDYVEYSASLNYDDRAWLEYSYSPDIFDTGFDTHNVAVFAEWQLAGVPSLNFADRTGVSPIAFGSYETMARLCSGCRCSIFASTSSEPANVTVTSPIAIGTVLRSTITKPRSASTTSPVP